MYVREIEQHTYVPKNKSGKKPNTNHQFRLTKSNNQYANI